MRQQRTLPRPPAHEDVIMFTVGGFRFAVAAAAVREIRGMEELHPFTLGGISTEIAKLAYTLERRGTTYFVVDAAKHFQLPPSTPTRAHAFTHEERGWYRGLAVVNGAVVPVVNQNAFLSKTEQAILRTGLERVQGVVTA